MKIPGFENPRCLFIDGPIAVYIAEEATEPDILEAMERLQKVVAVAARLIGMPVSNAAETPVHPGQWVQTKP